MSALSDQSHKTRKNCLHWTIIKTKSVILLVFSPTIKDYTHCARIYMPTPDVVTGSCLCQKVRYKVTGPPRTTIICHCDSCRKSTGSAFMANSFYLKNQLQVLAGEDALRVYHDKSTGSGKPLSRSFCSNCGSPLFISSESIDPTAVTVTSGTMDLGPARSEWEPKMEVFCARRREWLAPVEGTEKHDAMM